MKMMKQMACAALAAAVAVGISGCGDKDASAGALQPKVAEGTVMALVVRPMENTSLAPLCKQYGLSMVDLMKQAPGDAQEVIKELALDKVENKWVVVTLDALSADKIEKGEPDFAVAAATTLDLDKVVAVAQGKKQKIDKATIAGVPAYIVFEGENAIYNLGGGDLTVADVAGSGAISNANITVTGTLTVVVNDDGTIDPLEIDGKLTLGGNARLVVKGGRKLAFAAVEAISATGGVSGTFASVVSETGKPMKIVYEAGVVKVAKRGGMSICLQ